MAKAKPAAEKPKSASQAVRDLIAEGVKDLLTLSPKLRNGGR